MVCPEFYRRGGSTYRTGDSHKRREVASNGKLIHSWQSLVKWLKNLLFHELDSVACRRDKKDTSTPQASVKSVVIEASDGRAWTFVCQYWKLDGYWLLRPFSSCFSHSASSVLLTTVLEQSLWRLYLRVKCTAPFHIMGLGEGNGVLHSSWLTSSPTICCSSSLRDSWILLFPCLSSFP